MATCPNSGERERAGLGTFGSPRRISNYDRSLLSSQESTWSLSVTARGTLPAGIAPGGLATCPSPHGDPFPSPSAPRHDRPPAANAHPGLGAARSRPIHPRTAANKALGQPALDQLLDAPQVGGLAGEGGPRHAGHGGELGAVVAVEIAVDRPVGVQALALDGDGLGIGEHRLGAAAAESAGVGDFPMVVDGAE